MPRKTDPSRDLQAQKAAYLRARHNMSQEEIGTTLGGVSQPYVSRLLRRAEEMGWLVTQLHFVDRDIPEETLAEIYRLLEPRSLMEVLWTLGERTGRCIPNIRVFDSGSDSVTPQALEQRRQRFARSAAGSLNELIRAAQIVGVTWGRTVSELIEHLSGLHRGLSNQRTVQFVPVCAELVGLAMRGYSSSRLADRLNDIVNEGAGDHLSLAGVPAYIPRRYDRGKTEVLWEYVCDIGSYQKIFKQNMPLVAQMDALLTSVGSSDKPVGGSVAELVEAGEIDAKKLRSLVIGDIGGVLIPQPSLSNGDKRLIRELNEMWTGINLEHLQQTAFNASRNTKMPGNIVVALGRDKTPVLCEVIRMGLVNELMVDGDLAQSLEVALCDLL